MFLQKIKSGFENPSYEYSHNNVCYGLEGILKTYKMDTEVREKLKDYLRRINALSYYNHWTHTIDRSKFYECNSLFYELVNYLDEVTSVNG